jgi:hypothetical protein
VLARASINGAGGSGHRQCRLVWCVRTEGDYLSLASRLPPPDGDIEVTVYVTRSDAIDGSPIVASSEQRLPSRECTWAADDSSLHRPGRSMMWASLATSVVGLIVEYWGWAYIHKQLEADLGLGTYFLMRRCLPILLILASMLTTTLVAQLLVRFAARRYRGRRNRSEEFTSNLTQHDGTTHSRARPQGAQEGQTTRTAPVPTPSEHSVAGTQNIEEASAEANAGRPHQLRAGRPDLQALVRAAASACETRRLVVAVCGPPAQVEAARKVVAGSRDHCLHELGVHLELSGTDSRW